MAGGGVRTDDIAALAAVGVDAVHLSARRRSGERGASGPGGGESGFDVTDAATRARGRRRCGGAHSVNPRVEWRGPMDQRLPCRSIGLGRVVDMSPDPDDDALRWEGDDDPTLAPGWKGVGAGPARGRIAGDGCAASVGRATTRRDRRRGHRLGCHAAGRLDRARDPRGARRRLPALRDRLAHLGHRAGARARRPGRPVHVRTRPLVRRGSPRRCGSAPCSGSPPSTAARGSSGSSRGPCCSCPFRSCCEVEMTEASAPIDGDGGVTDATTTPAARPATPLWLAVTIAVLFGVLYAYDVWEAVRDLVGMSLLRRRSRRLVRRRRARPAHRGARRAVRSCSRSRSGSAGTATRSCRWCSSSPGTRWCRRSPSTSRRSSSSAASTSPDRATV